MDETRCSLVSVKPPFSFEENDGQQEMSLTKAMAMSRIHCQLPSSKVKSNKESTSLTLRFARDDEFLTKIHEYESHHAAFKDQIWYSQDEFERMMEDLDEATKRRRRHIAGIRKCYIHTILDLQERHRFEEIQDPKGLACMAKRCTKYSTRDAARRGKELELELIVASATSSISGTDSSESPEPSGTLDILKSVLGMMGEMDATSHKKQDTSLRPPMRLVSPRQQD